LKRLFGKFKSKKTEEAPAAAPPAVTITAENEKTGKSEPAAEVAEELAKTEPVAEPADPPVVETAEAPAEPVKPEPAAEPVAEADAEPVAEAPKPKPAKTKTSKAKTPAEPKAESPKAESAKAETPKVESPKAESPKAASPKAKTSKDEAAEGPFGAGSAAPLADGAAPGEEFTVKGKKSSKLFHTAESPYFGRTKADVWFKTPADAERAGFAAWNHKKKAAAGK
jgi:hypothetical protein